MHIFHVIGSLDPKTGGPPAVVMRLGSATAALGHSVSILCRDTGPSRDLVVESLRQVRGHEAMDLVFGDTSGEPDATLARADFLHLHGVWEPILLRCAKTARRLGVPYTVTPHGMLDPWALSQKRLKKRIALALAFRGMLNRASFLHMLNADERRLAEPVGIRAPMRVIPNGIFLEELEPLPSPGTFRTAHPELGDRPFVLFLSRLHHKKGPDVLAAAFSDLARRRDDVTLVVIGPDEGSRPMLEAAIRKQGVADRVFLLGPVYGPDKYAAVVDAAVFCLPSRQEGFSIAITEALACRCPVVVTEACHFPEVAEVDAGRVVPLDAVKVADGLAEVLADPESAASMGRRGRAMVAERFTWPKVAEAMLEAYGACSEGDRKM